MVIRAILPAHEGGIRLTNSLVMTHPSSFSALTHLSTLTADTTVLEASPSVCGQETGFSDGRRKSAWETFLVVVSTTSKPAECCGVRVEQVGGVVWRTWV